MLPNICCSGGACRTTPYWPVDDPQEGWLQLDATAESSTPVTLFTFSSRGVCVVIPAHGAGCNTRQVHCCGQRAHPEDPQLQCVGLRFDVTTVP